MAIKGILELFIGIAMFLFGMNLMGDGLKQVAGNKLEVILYKLTGSPIKGMLFGTGITTVIQSSSATSVMVVGFVNSGMMRLRQAIPVVLGAILGTSITGWVICLSNFDGASGWVALFSSTSLTCITAVVGVILRLFTKSRLKHHVGDILLGFSVLMLGMSTMSGAMAPIKENATFIGILTTFSNPIIGILVGVGFTCVLQSASAAVGILQALTVTGSIRFDIALPLIMGISIGAAVPVLLSAVGATRDGKRTALSYLISNLCGVILFAVVFYGLNAFIDYPFSGTIMDTVTVALMNTLYRLVVVLVLMPLYRQIGTISGWLVPESEQPEDLFNLVPLEERFIPHPTLALEQSRKAIGDMAGRARDNLLRALELLHHYVPTDYTYIKNQETAVDQYEDVLGTYLLKVNASELDADSNKNLSTFLHTIADFERISDHAMNLADSAKELYEKNNPLSSAARVELQTIETAVAEVVGITIDAFLQNNLSKAARVEPLEEVIDSLCNQLKLHHVDRMKQGLCSFDTGFIFNDLLTNYERVADHCSNIAAAMIEIESDSFDTHAYLRTVKRLKLESFEVYYDEYAEKYDLERVTSVSQ